MNYRVGFPLCRQGGGGQLHGDAARILPTRQGQDQRGRPGRGAASGSPAAERHHPGGSGQVRLVSKPPNVTPVDYGRMGDC